MDQTTGVRLYHLDRSLPERRVLKLSAAQGARVVSLAGDVWITEDARYDDVVLAAGESAVLERNGTAMITPFGSADVEIVLPAAAAAKPFERTASEVDLIGHHIRSAHRMRARAMATAFADAVEWLRGKLRPAPHTHTECCA